jgi:hypothetical protein
MTALYVLTGQYHQLAEQLSNLDLDAQTVADTIEASGITDELSVKAQGVEMVARGAEAHNLAIDAEIARLQALKDHRAKVAQGLRTYLHSNMVAAGIEKIACPLFTITVRKNPPAVTIDDASTVPAQYKRTPEPTPPIAVPDKAAIKAALQGGEVVAGARLTQSTRLEIK